MFYTWKIVDIWNCTTLDSILLQYFLHSQNVPKKSTIVSTFASLFYNNQKLIRSSLELSSSENYEYSSVVWLSPYSVDQNERRVSFFYFLNWTLKSIVNFPDLSTKKLLYRWVNWRVSCEKLFMMQNIIVLRVFHTVSHLWVNCGLKHLFQLYLGLGLRIVQISKLNQFRKIPYPALSKVPKTACTWMCMWKPWVIHRYN